MALTKSRRDQPNMTGRELFEGGSGFTPSTMNHQPDQPRQARLRPNRPAVDLAVVRLGFLVVMLVLFGIALLIVGPDGIRDRLSDAAASRWGVFAFVGVYAVAVVLLMPGTVGTVSAGALFGFRTAFLAALSGALIGATVAFLVARWLGRDGAERLLGKRLTTIDSWLGRNGFVSILIVRLLPIFPFNALNYAAGLSSVRLKHYVAGTAIGILPGTALTTNVGAQAGDPTSPAFLVSVGLVLATIVGSGLIAKRLKTRTGMDMGA